MNLDGIVSVSGKSGLYKALGQNKSGVILEALDASRSRIIANANSRVAALRDITIFGQDEDIKLTDIFTSMKGEKSIADAKSDGAALRNFFSKVAPNHDAERVYASDIKKIIQWFTQLNSLGMLDVVVTKETIADADAEVVKEEKPKKAKAAASTTKEASAEKPKKATKKADK